MGNDEIFWLWFWFMTFSFILGSLSIFSSCQRAKHEAIIKCQSDACIHAIQQGD